MIIYVAINKINGKYYIGQTISTLSHRIQQHLSTKRQGLLHRALDINTLKSLKEKCQKQK